ncbi:MAG TPA: hypothetical protein VGJ44_20095 [Kribbellaceae bacterium]
MSVSTLELALLYEHNRIRELAAPAHDPASASPERRHQTDWFYAIASQHLAAAEDVLLPKARPLPGGPEMVAAYVANARKLERGLRFLKGRMYGDSRVLHLRRDELWREIDLLLDEHEALEKDLGAMLDEHLGDEVARLTEKLLAAEENAPTRAHPNSPHTGVAGRVAHRMWRLADTAWDSAEGRVVPTRYREHPKKDSGFTHYLLGTPIEEETAEPTQREAD